MRKIILIMIALTFAFAFFAGCARQKTDVRDEPRGDVSSSLSSSSSSSSSSSVQPSSSSSALPSSSSVQPSSSSAQFSSQAPVDAFDIEAARILEKMTLRQKIGQTVSLAIYGYEDQAALEAFLREYQPGMIFYLGNGVNSIEDMRPRNNRIRALFRSAGLLDPIIALDQEGGIVARLTRNVTHFPSAMALAATGDEDLVFRAGMAIGRQLRRAGCAMAYAPVLDLNLNAANPVIGTRSFSDKPDLVLRYGRAFARGLLEAGVLPVVKHFPGHGRTGVDSHLALPIVSTSREELLKSDFSIFKNLDESTFPAVMTAHVVYSDIDSMPATLSKKIIQDWYQRECGYKGLIMTDAVNMKALSARWSYPEIHRLALTAGCHLLTTGMDFTSCRVFIQGCESFAAQGKLDTRIVDAAAAKVIAFKLRQKKYLQEPSDPFGAAQLAHDRAEDDALVRTIAERALTLVQDPLGIFPLKAGTSIHLLTTSPRFLGYVQRAAAVAGNGVTLGRYEVVRGDSPASPYFIQQLRQHMQVSGRVLVFAGESAHDARFLDSLPEDLRQGILIAALHDPWFARRFMHRNSYLAAYSSVDLSLEACARALLGLVPVRGRSPVTIASAGR